MKKCPYCAEEIQDEAIKCRYCMEFLQAPRIPRMAPPPAPGSQPPLPWYFRTPNIVLALLCIGPLALPMVWWRPRTSIKAKAALTVGVLLLTWLLGMMAAWAIGVIMDTWNLAASMFV